MFWRTLSLLASLLGLVTHETRGGTLSPQDVSAGYNPVDPAVFSLPDGLGNADSALAAVEEVLPLLIDDLPTLVVVDMQTGFLGDSDQWVIQNVEQQIVHAVQHGWRILVLEFEDYGETHPDLKRHLVGYPRAHILTKGVRDGSPQMVAEEVRQQVTTWHYVVCGAYADQCVAATAERLAIARPCAWVEVVTYACKPYEQDFTWASFPTQPNIRLYAEAA